MKLHHYIISPRLVSVSSDPKGRPSRNGHWCCASEMELVKTPTIHTKPESEYQRIN